MKKPKRLWSASDLATLIHMREVGREKWSVIDRAFARAVGSSATKYESLRRGKLPRHPTETGGRIEVSTGQESERLARQEAERRRDLTGEVFGDPPPGYSALDRRKQCGGTGLSSGTGARS